MPRFPLQGVPFQYYRPYNYKYQFVPSTTIPTIKETASSAKSSAPSPKSSDPVWFDLFGIKLYFDDVLILSLLFFLYKEEVKDEGLFLALILLLIS